MASQMLASVKGMSACTTPNEASASTTEASCGCHSRPGHARTPIGRYLRVGVRHRLNRAADLDGEVGAEPGLKIPGRCASLPWPSWLSGLYRGDRDDILATSM